jgi:hypothetical protein
MDGIDAKTDDLIRIRQSGKRGVAGKTCTDTCKHQKTTDNWQDGVEYTLTLSGINSHATNFTASYLIAAADRYRDLA